MKTRESDKCMDIKYKENVIALRYLQRYTPEFHEMRETES
jgi:hypothetical protein